MRIVHTWIGLSIGVVLGGLMFGTPLHITIIVIVSMGAALLSSYMFGDYK